MKALYLYPGAGSPVLDYERRLVDSINTEENDIDIEFWDWTAALQLTRNPSLSWARQNRDRLYPFYQEVIKRAGSFDVVLISQTGGILPEIMEEIPSCVVYTTADDPDSSESCSFPFLKVADVIAHAGVNFDSKRSVSDVFTERGANRCIHFPLGFYEEMFPAIDDFDAQFERRDVDLVYIGHLKRGKQETIMNTFPEMVVHSRTLRLRHKLYLLLKTRRWVTPFSGNLGELYRRCKVGVNFHFTYGPSNARCYQLNACGVAQVMDCPEGHAELYRPGIEILGYETIEEATEQIRTLLDDDALRYSIAKEGYLCARSRYNRKGTLLRLLRSI